MKPMGNPNVNHVMIKLSADNDFIAVSTYCRRHGRRGRFLILRDRVKQILSGDHGTLYDSDCGNHVCIHNYDNRLHLIFDWLSEYSDGTLKGFRQRIEVPCEVFATVMDTGERIRYLYRSQNPQAHINAVPAAKAIREVTKSSITRSALRKALRDNFHWRSDNVTLYRDYGTSFYFETSSGCPMNGGLILHETTVRTPLGVKPKLYYSVHT